ncbi:MAG: hypothetical protein ACT6FE_05965 [Methanosarcinaceae archaeon]
MNTRNLSTPILLLMFNRPKQTFRVFDEIRKARPKQFFIAADGPRANHSTDKQQCIETRKIIDSVDWPCKIHTLFREKNLGCGKAISSAITWFFENVEQGIILEDDCLPNQSFFYFCQKLLEKYKYDSRIFHISGSNYQIPLSTYGYSYFFSKIPYVWGWATWKRAWEKYDFNLNTYPSFKKEKIISHIYNEKGYQQERLATFDRMYKKQEPVWDHQWFYTVLTQNGLCITPHKNLVSNIGCGKDALHPSNPNSMSSNIPKEKLDTNNLVHPQFIMPNQTNDLWAMENIFEIKPYVSIRSKAKTIFFEKKHKFANNHKMFKIIFNKLLNRKQ